MQLRSLGWEDALEKEMTTRSLILAWKVPWAEEPGMLQSMGLQRIGHYNCWKLGKPALKIGKKEGSPEGKRQNPPGEPPK